MKNFNKQILEAVNRGIQLALDDYIDDFENSLSSAASSKEYIDVDDVLRRYVELYHYVDLGLPSRTWWCKYNLGVSLKSRNPNKSLIGGYYAWGELKPKKEFTIKRYKFGEDVIEAGSTKYNREDGINQLLSEDDVVTQTYKDSRYHIPTLEQAQELIDNTDLYCINKTNPFEYANGIPQFKTYGDYNEGWLLVSKINGRYIYIPHTGYYDGRRIIYDDTPSTSLWTSTVYDNTCAQTLSFCTGASWRTKLRYIYGMWKHHGLQIRPVYNKND